MRHEAPEHSNQAVACTPRDCSRARLAVTRAVIDAPLREGISWLTAAAITVMTTALWLLILSGIRLLGEGSATAPDEQAMALSPLHLALAQTIAFTTVLLLVTQPWSRFASTLRLTRPTALTVATGLLGGLSLQFPLAEIGNMVHEVWPMSIEERARLADLLVAESMSEGVVIAVAFIVVAPVTEELLFRGFILNELAHRYGSGVALVWSSLLFGLAHLSLTASIYATVAGLILGAMALKTRSTTTSIVLHAGVNAAAVLLPATVVEVPGFNTLPQDVEHVPWTILLGASTVTALSFLAILKQSR